MHSFPKKKKKKRGKKKKASADGLQRILEWKSKHKTVFKSMG